MSSSINLTPSFQGASWYGAPNGKQVHFHFASVAVEFSILGGTYSPPIGNFVPFSYELLGQNLYPLGLSHSIFGVPRLPQDKNLNVTGFVATSFSLPFVRLQYRYVNAVGWSVTPFGTPNVYNRDRWLYVQGTANTTRWGTAIVQNRDIHPWGWVESPKFGWPNAYNKTRKIYPLWQATELIGTVKVNNAKFTIPGLVHTAFGLPFIENKRKIITPPGMFTQAWGSAWVSNSKRQLFVQQYSQSAEFGTFSYTHSWLTPKGFAASAFGTAVVQAKDQHVFVNSFMQRLFSNKTEVNHRNRPIYPISALTELFGVPDVIPKIVKPWGFIATEISYYGHRVGGTRITNVKVNNATLFGNYFVAWTPRYVAVSGGDYTLFGNPPYGVMHTFPQNIESLGADCAVLDLEDWDYRVSTYILEVDYARDVNVTETSSFGMAGVTQ